MSWQNVLIAASVSACIAGCSDSGMSVKIEQNGNGYVISNDLKSPSQIELRHDRFKIITPSLGDTVAIQVCGSFDEAALEAVRKGINVEKHECFYPGTGMAMENTNAKDVGVPMYISDGTGHNYYSIERRYEEGGNAIVNVEKIEPLVENKNGDIYLVFFIDLNSNQEFDLAEVYAARVDLLGKFNP